MSSLGSYKSNCISPVNAPLTNTNNAEMSLEMSNSSQNPIDLNELLSRWDTLPEEIKQAILKRIQGGE